MSANFNDNLQPGCKKIWFVIALIFAFFGSICAYQCYEINLLRQKLSDAQKIYVYDLQDTLRGLKIDEINAQFEAKVNILNHEVLTAQNKISSLKDANVQADFSDVYLNSLKNKRDDMIKEYNDTLQNITNQINDNLVKIAHEYNAPTIFNKNAVSAFTPNVVDVTNDVIKRIQLNYIYNMLK